MRKLILIGIIWVVGIIVWISYLKYDAHRFIKEWSSTPEVSSPTEQQAKDTVKDASVPASGYIIESTTGDEQASQHPTEDGLVGTFEDVVHPDRLRTNAETGREVLGSGQTSDGTKLSPEIVVLYTDLQPLYDEYAKVGWEYMQVMTKMHESVNRKTEIIQEGASNPETQQELRQLQTWIEANYSTYKELHNETVRRNDVMQTFLKSRGYSSGFDWQAFITWRRELSK